LSERRGGNDRWKGARGQIPDGTSVPAEIEVRKTAAGEKVAYSEKEMAECGGDTKGTVKDPHRGPISLNYSAWKTRGWDVE